MVLEFTPSAARNNHSADWWVGLASTRACRDARAARAVESLYGAPHV